MPSALVLTMSDGGDGGHDATSVPFIAVTSHAFSTGPHDV